MEEAANEEEKEGEERSRTRRGGGEGEEGRVEMAAYRTSGHGQGSPSLAIAYS